MEIQIALTFTELRTYQRAQEGAKRVFESMINRAHDFCKNPPDHSDVKEESPLYALEGL